MLVLFSIGFQPALNTSYMVYFLSNAWQDQWILFIEYFLLLAVMNFYQLDRAHQLEYLHIISIVFVVVHYKHFMNWLGCQWLPWLFLN